MLTQQTFKVLFDTNFDAIRNYIFYRTGDEELSSDLAQDVFMKIWEKRKQWDSSAPLKPLLYKIANDFIINKYRKDAVKIDFKNYLQYQTSSIEKITPEEDLEGEDLKKRYNIALKTMTEAQRVAFLMHREENCKYHEIAERLQISQKAVEKRISNALQIIKKLLVILVLILGNNTF